MGRLNVERDGIAASFGKYCDRLYDVLLAKAYRRHYSPTARPGDEHVDYDITLIVECNSKGVVRDVRIAE